MNNLKFYSEKNLQLLRDNIDNLEQEATKKGYIVLDPKNEEYKQVNTIILEYIIEKKRIIYGGTAYHKIIQHYRKDKDNDKKIYPDWERYDIEFYSPTPIADLVAICNRLYNNKIKYVIGRQAQHNETFTIFANFLQYCDMSYMPSSIYNKIKTLNIDGATYIHPELILIDIFRMYNDPLTSYWRLGKVFKRMELLMNKFEYDFKKVEPLKLQSLFDNEIYKIISYIIPQIYDKFNILFIGELTYLIYTSPDTKINIKDKLSQIEIITDNLDEVYKLIKQLLSKFAGKNNMFNKFDELFSFKEYSRFFQYWDKRNVIYYKGKPLITIIGSNHRCIPYLKSKIDIDNGYEIMIGSFLVTFNYFFIGYYYELINKIGFYYGDRNFINSLLTVRNEYLEKNNKTIFDDTIYKEFIIDCSGETMDFSREFLLEMNRKREKGIKGIFTYDPNISIGTQIANIEFEQSDGLEIIG
jgi:hypothetical protein